VATGSTVLQGVLRDQDPMCRHRSARAQVHPVRLQPGKTYTIDMISRDFDSYLYVEDPSGAVLASDDDSGGYLNARVKVTVPVEMEIKIVATALKDTCRGAYIVRIQQTDDVATAGDVGTLTVSDKGLGTPTRAAAPAPNNVPLVLVPSPRPAFPPQPSFNPGAVLWPSHPVPVRTPQSGVSPQQLRDLQQQTADDANRAFRSQMEGTGMAIFLPH
jgi:hypothetical protein